MFNIYIGLEKGLENQEKPDKVWKKVWRIRRSRIRSGTICTSAKLSVNSNQIFFT